MLASCGANKNFIRMIGSSTYVLTETLLVEVARALHVAVVVGGILGILVKLEGTITRLGHVSAHEGCRVLLKLRALGLHFKLLIAVESRSVLAIYTRLLVHIRSLCVLSSARRLDLEAWLRLFLAIEGGIVGHKG